MTRLRRPRYRKHRRLSRRFGKLLVGQSTKWSGHESAINITVVGSNALDLATDPGCHGPFTLRGAKPPELRDYDRIWLGDPDGGYVCSVFGSMADAAPGGRGPISIASWDLSPDMLSLTATAKTVATLTAGPVVAAAAVVLAENTLFSAAHGLATGTLVRLTTSSALPAGLAAATNYWVIAVDADRIAFASSLANSAIPTAIDITDAGVGNTTINICAVDTTTEAVKTATAHGFATGDGPVRLTTDGALPTGLSAATDYWLIAVDTTHLQFATTEANAIALTAVNITAIGSGTQTITLAGVDIGDEALLVTAHGMQTGDGPVRVSSTGTLPVGLAAATDYYVIKVDANHIALATSRVNALASTKINLTGIGVGTHQLVRALTIGKDLSSGGLLEWLAQGVPLRTMQTALVGAVDTVFV